MRILAIALVLLSTSCGVVDQRYDHVNRRVVSSTPSMVVADNPPQVGDPDVDKWTELFYFKAKEANKLVNDNVKIRFAEEDEFKGSVIGTCVWYSTYEDVRLRTTWWNEVSDCHRGLLVIHELGHCALNLDHAETGVMTPYIAPKCEDGDVEKALTALLADMK